VAHRRSSCCWKSSLPIVRPLRSGHLDASSASVSESLVDVARQAEAARARRRTVGSPIVRWGWGAAVHPRRRCRRHYMKETRPPPPERRLPNRSATQGHIGVLHARNLASGGVRHGQRQNCPAVSTNSVYAESDQTYAERATAAKSLVAVAHRLRGGSRCGLLLGERWHGRWCGPRHDPDTSMPRRSDQACCGTRAASGRAHLR